MCDMRAVTRPNPHVCVCSCVFIFFTRCTVSVFSDLIKGKQRGSTAPRHSCVFKRCWTHTAKWRSLLHVNDPFIFLITNVNHRKPDTAHTASLQWAACLYAWSHVVWWELHPSLSVSHLCRRLSVHIRHYAYGAAARLRIQHGTVISSIGYVWTHLICVCAVWGNREKALIVKTSLACDGGYYMCQSIIMLVNRRLLGDMICELTNKEMIWTLLFYLSIFLPFISFWFDMNNI